MIKQSVFDRQEPSIAAEARVAGAVDLAHAAGADGGEDGPRVVLAASMGASSLLGRLRHKP